MLSSLNTVKQSGHSLNHQTIEETRMCFYPVCGAFSRENCTDTLQFGDKAT